MKPPRFEFTRARSLEHALEVLAASGPDAKILAGGQSLIPMLSMRLVRPTRLVDVNALAEFSYQRLEDGHLAVGALTRHRAVERSRLVAEHASLLSAAIPYVGHVAIRNRGTIGGSVTHADPAAEIPAILRALDATVVVRGPEGTRRIAASDLVIGPFTTTLEPTEVLVEIRIPVQPEGTGASVVEVARRHGDFAIVGVAMSVRVRDRALEGVRSVAFGTGSVAQRLTRTETALEGSPVTDESLSQAAEVARSEVEPLSDIHATADYRRWVAGELVVRAVRAAAATAGRRSQLGGGQR